MREAFYTWTSPGIWIHASLCAPWSSKMVWLMCKRAAESWRIPHPKANTRSRLTRRKPCLQPSRLRIEEERSESLRSLSESVQKGDPAARQLRLVHLQPRPVSRRARVSGRGAPQRQNLRRGDRQAQAGEDCDFAGAL